MDDLVSCRRSSHNATAAAKLSHPALLNPSLCSSVKATARPLGLTNVPMMSSRCRSRSKSLVKVLSLSQAKSGR